MKLKIISRKLVDGFNWRYKVPESNVSFSKRINKFMSAVKVTNTCVEGSNIYIFYINKN